jgi:hypothetical protein
MSDDDDDDDDDDDVFCCFVVFIVGLFFVALVCCLLFLSGKQFRVVFFSEQNVSANLKFADYFGCILERTNKFKKIFLLRLFPKTNTRVARFRFIYLFIYLVIFFFFQLQHVLMMSKNDTDLAISLLAQN